MHERAALPLPWLDRRGNVSLLKSLVFAGVLAPGLWLLFRAATGSLGPRPYIEINHQTGLWAIRFLLISLAVTPLRHVWRWGDLIQLRRMLGLAAFAYAVIHLVAYAGDLGWDFGKVVSEIIARPYLTIGFVALLMLVPLAATSTEGMMRRMGGIEWRALHRLVYPVAALATVHFFLQSKLGVTEPIVMAAIAAWLALWRLLAARIGEQKAGTLAATVILAIVIVVATGLGEALYYYLKVGAPFSRVLPTNFAWKTSIRPAWIVLGISLAVIAVAAIRIPIAARKPSRRAQAGVAAKPASGVSQRQGKAA
ncbi:sulfoxide reductase heme-binding subunit YedZ [Kaistia geumhonensis]|uniref:Protein-methionine-sulfoxide reductase heme-binding subunit MsrQ n=1 Tax=Kaistia geumhonensis TaxID=410839 RepID=A0ABU0M1V9_9HYPH|nr:protein-methionine-sulfoxide reductase heme-binding subunit MsrQ [Kaistia geumhonensis]MCX5479840.1 sulfoxide reductase heme-binding subunit YedZ [Kaistia geumhonensis]MDQ0514934.1 sulfoxide reductase heme-binding subunit YedZ [Kaistia geumhonensis]